jgi:predicted PurR-regulated permease PerM
MQPSDTQASTDRQDRAFHLLLVIVTIAFLVLLSDLYKAVLWAIVFSLLTHNLHSELRTRLPGHENLAASIVVLVVTFLVVMPAILFGAIVAREAARLVEKFQDGEADASATIDWLADLMPTLRQFAEQIGLNLDRLGSQLSESLAAGGQFVASQALVFGQGAFRVTILLIVTLYLFFFLLRDGERIRALIYRALPMDRERRDYLVHEAVGITRATIKGMLAIGVIQGLIGGVAFAALGLDSAVLWGAAMAVTSIIPIVGTALIWLPAALALLAGGYWIKATVLIVIGVVFIGLVDNILRPVMVRHETRMPDYVVLLSTLGGIGLFGISGFVIGPLIAGVFLACWKIYGLEQDAEPRTPA